MLIGTFAKTRIACTDDEHFLMVFNAQMNVTVCQCGRLWARGKHTTWHERFVRRNGAHADPVIGYDQYTLHGCMCHREGKHTA